MQSNSSIKPCIHSWKHVLSIVVMEDTASLSLFPLPLPPPFLHSLSLLFLFPLSPLYSPKLAETFPVLCLLPGYLGLLKANRKLVLSHIVVRVGRAEIIAPPAAPSAAGVLPASSSGEYTVIPYSPNFFNRSASTTMFCSAWRARASQGALQVGDRSFHAQARVACEARGSYFSVSHSSSVY